VHDAGQLELKPPFQRNPVWTDAQKSFLIDSVLRGYPIPELYMQESVTASGREHYIVVDGQQRVRACLEFVEGRFTLEPKECPEWPDADFDDLTDDQRKKIFGYNFIVRQLPPVPDEELRLLFARLNRNSLVLNRQELRHATYWGSFIKCVEGLAELEWWTTSGVFTANDVRRMLDIEFISEIVIAFLHGLQNKKSSLDKWYATYEREFVRASDVVSVFQTVLGEFSHVLPSIGTTRWRKKSDFYSLFLVFAEHSGKLPLSKAGRKSATKVLTEFGAHVDEYLTGNSPRAAAGIKKYAEAVERAASDLSNRRARADALSVLLQDVW
jgi:Protein of unknown function DUF262